MAKLGEVCLLKAGKFVSANDISPEYNKGLYPCFGGNGIRGYVADYTHDGEFPLIGRQGALCGNVNLASGKFHATEHAVVVQPKIEMNVHWLYYALNAMNLGQYATGAAQPGLAVSKLETLSIEIPNISEQNKIAQTLYKVEQLVNFRKQQLAKLDELVKARFVEMFENNLWPNTSLNDICSEIVDCPHSTPKYEGNLEHPAIRTTEIKKGYIDWDSMKYVSEEEYQKRIKSLKPVPGDIVYGREGTYGNAAIIPDGYEFCLGQRVMLFRPNKTKCISAYVLYAILSDHVKRQADEKNVGATVPHVNVADAKQFDVVLPPLSIQNQFAAFVERVDQQKQTVQQSLEKLELMKKALMQEYFG